MINTSQTETEHFTSSLKSSYKTRFDRIMHGDEKWFVI